MTQDSVVKLWELSTSRCLIAYTGAGTTGMQVNQAQAVFNQTEDFVSLVLRLVLPGFTMES